MGCEEGFTMKNFIVFTIHLIYLGLLRWAGYVTRMEGGRNGFKVLTAKSTGNKPLSVDGRTILELILKISVNTRNWIDWTHDRDFWRALVNAALKFQVPYATERVS